MKFNLLLMRSKLIRSILQLSSLFKVNDNISETIIKLSFYEFKLNLTQLFNFPFKISGSHRLVELLIFNHRHICVIKYFNRVSNPRCDIINLLVRIKPLIHQNNIAIVLFVPNHAPYGLVQGPGGLLAVPLMTRKLLDLKYLVV